MGIEKLNFVSLDVETANYNRSSICQIGIATVRSGKIVEVWSELVNPETDFIHTSIHGIDDTMVLKARTFKEIYHELEKRLSGIVVSHTSFDKNAISEACQLHSKPMFRVQWLDSAEMVRRAWPDRYGKRGYNLKNVARDLGIDFRHHDAWRRCKGGG